MSGDSFGRYLLRERELRGLGRDDVARLTRLAPSVVEALESGDAAGMPPRAYLIGYLRSYAAAVGLDPDEVVLRWQELEGAAPGPVARAAPRPRPRGLAVAAAIALAAALAAALLVARGAPPARERAHPAGQGDRARP